ncbi:hypothetical protein CFOL_v3_28415, partial [Cephalotus follicularis]
TQNRNRIQHLKNSNIQTLTTTVCTIVEENEKTVLTKKKKVTVPEEEEELSFFFLAIGLTIRKWHSDEEEEDLRLETLISTTFPKFQELGISGIEYLATQNGLRVVFFTFTVPRCIVTQN